LHYELLDRVGDPAVVGVELHLESGEYPELIEFLESLVASLAPDFPDVQYSPKWFKGCRLVVPMPMADTNGAVRVMNELIVATRERTAQQLRESGLLENGNANQPG